MTPPQVPSATRARYERLVDAHAASLWRLAWRLTRDADDAEDLVQETYYEAWRSLGSLRQEGAARAWLVRILIHRGAHRLRRARRKPLRPGLDSERVAAPLQPTVLATMADREVLEQALAALEPDRRTVILLVFQEGFSCREVGEMLDIPRGTVLSRLHRARHDLRRDLGAHDLGEAAV